MRFTFFSSLALGAMAAFEAHARLDGMNIQALAQVLSAY